MGDINGSLCTVKTVYLSSPQMLSWTSPAGFCQWQESMQQVIFLLPILRDTCQSSAVLPIRWALVAVTQWPPIISWHAAPIQGVQIVQSLANAANAKLIAPFSLRTSPVLLNFGSNDSFPGIHRKVRSILNIIFRLFSRCSDPKITRLPG